MQFTVACEDATDRTYALAEMKHMELKKMVSTAAKAVGVSSTMKMILSKPVLRDITYKYSALVGDVTLTADGKPRFQAVLLAAANRYNA